jgi:hypothetical protein
VGPRSGGTACFEGDDTLADVDRGLNFAIEAIDAIVDPPKFGNHLVAQRIEPCAEARVEIVDLAGQPNVQVDDLVEQPRLDAVDLLIERDEPLVDDTDIAAEGMDLRRDDILKRLLERVVCADTSHSISVPSSRQCP